MTAPNRQLPITLIVNGERKELLVKPLSSLLDALRFKLDLRGAHRGCDTGHCGNCTVLVKKPGPHASSVPVVSCLILAL
jgi:aerobic-type carbon monoxide dehydrogenase small subunit (CoxS/CutS family)